MPFFEKNVIIVWSEKEVRDTQENELRVYSASSEIGDVKICLYRVEDHSFERNAEEIGSGFAPNHSHLYYECHFVENGELEFKFGKELISLKGGEIMIIPPFVEHYPLESSLKGHIAFAFTLEKTEGEEGFFENFVRALASVCVLPFKAGAELASCIKLFLESFSKSGAGGFCKRKILAYQLCYQLFCAIKGLDFNLNEYSVAPERVNIALLDHLVNCNHYSVPLIADRIGYTPRHTTRLIKQLYGKSLGEVRMNNMTKTAKKLLENSDWSLGKIAEAVGFSSLAAMNKMFFKVEGVYPAKYRKNFRGEDS